MRLQMLSRGMFRRMADVRTRIWLLGCGIATVGFAALCLWTLSVERSEIDRRAEVAASAAAETAARDIARTVERFDLAMQATVGRLSTPAVMSLEEPIRSLVLFDRSSGLQPLGFISVLDETGTVTQSSQPTQLGTRWQGRDYFVAQRDNPSLGLFIGKPFGQDDFISIPLSQRISRDDGTFGGVVVASLRLSSVRDLFTHLPIGENGSVSLLLNDGMVLMHLPFDHDAIGRSAAPQGPTDRVAVRQIGQLPLSVQVSVAREDIAGRLQLWLLAALASGGALGCLCIGLIVVLRRELRRREAAERDSRHKSEYLAMTTHELRTPLHSILGNADRLRAEAAMDAVNARRLGAITSAGHHLRGVVDRVLNHLQIEQRLPTPHMNRVDLNELIDQCCTFVEADTAAKGLSLRYGFKPGAPEHFVTDANLLRQVVLNLLSNAVKFTERGGVTIEVGGTIERITIEVSDNGRGVCPAQRHKLFRQGERLGAEKSEVPGHGNGLAMSQRLVQCMGGEIGYRENPSGGSIFWVGLPEGRLSEATADQPATGARASRPLRVLLVEDVASHREIARAFLLDGGHLVSEAQSGADALRQAAEVDFDVVLMNLGLPGMNGVEAMKRIRMIPGDRGRVTIVGMTASVPDRQIVEALQTGMAAYLVKPFTAGELLTLLDHVARRRPLALLGSQATFEPDTLAQLASCMSFSEMEGHLLGLARTLELLINALNDVETSGARTGELVHEVAVTAGRYGFAALSLAAREFDAAQPATAGPLAVALSAAARAALAELHELVSAEPVDAS